MVRRLLQYFSITSVYSSSLLLVQDGVHSRLRYWSLMITWHSIPITVSPFSIFFLVSGWWRVRDTVPVPGWPFPSVHLPVGGRRWWLLIWFRVAGRVPGWIPLQIGDLYRRRPSKGVCDVSNTLPSPTHSCRTPPDSWGLLRSPEIFGEVCMQIPVESSGLLRTPQESGRVPC